MSTTIDEEVLSLKFDNASFMKGIADVEGALAGLKKTLAMEGAKKGLEEVSGIAKNMNFGQAADAVVTLADKFSQLQVVALGALAAIGSKAADLAVQLGKDILGNFTSQIKGGFADYNTKLTSVQTIMNATGSDIDTVNGYFSQLDSYSDKTIYNLSDMTSAFAKFTNVGIGMETSVPAIKGIANMVALAGQGAEAASGAMYNLSQSISTGFLTTSDFKSLNIANVATKDWKDNMVKAAVAAGTLQDLGGGAYHIVGTKAGSAYDAASLFNDALAEGWASSEVLLDVLGEYGDETTELGKKALAAAQDVKSLPMMLETLNASLGTGWTDTFEIILGNVTEATELFSYLTSEIGAFNEAGSEARNSQLRLWAEMGGREALVQALHNVFEALHSVLTPIGKAWKEVFPPSLGETLFKISKAIQNFTEGLILSEEAQDRLYLVAKGLFTVFKFGVDIVSAIARVMWELGKTLFTVGAAVLDVLTPVLDFFLNLFKGSEAATEGVDNFGNAMKWLNTNAIEPLVAGLVWLKDAIDGLINGGEAQLWADNISNAFGKVLEFGQGIVINWSAIGEFMKKTWEFVLKIKDQVVEFFSGFGDNVKSGFNSIDWDTVLAAINTGLFGAIILSFKKYLDLGSGLVDSITGMFEGVTGALKGMQNELNSKALINIAIAIAILAASLALMSFVNMDNIGPAIGALGATVAILATALYGLSKLDMSWSASAKLPLIAGALVIMALAVAILAGAIYLLAQIPYLQLALGLGAVTVALTIMVSALVILSENTDKVNAAAAAMLVMATALGVMAGVIAIFGAMDIWQLAQGMGAMAIAIAIMAGVLVLLSKQAMGVLQAAQAMAIMAGALAVLVGVIALLGAMDIMTLVQGFAYMTVIIGVFVIALLMLSKNTVGVLAAAQAMLLMSAAVVVLVGALAILGAIPYANLIQGIYALIAVVSILVITMFLMEKMVLGAAAMIIVAGAVFILALAVATLGNIPFENLVMGIGALAAIFVVLILAGLGLSFVVIPLVAVGAALALFGLGMVAVAFSMVILAAGLLLFSLVAPLAAAGLKVLADSMILVSNAIPAFLGVGLGLLVFGIGAAAAGVGVLFLAVALITLGIGLTLLAATGLLGVTALQAIVKGLMKLMDQIIPMGILGAAIGVLGGGILILGAAVVVAGAGLILMGVGLILVSVAIIAAAAGMYIMAKAIEKLSPYIDDMAKLTKEIEKLGKAGAQAGAGTAAAALTLGTMAAALLIIGSGVAVVVGVISTGFPVITAVVTAAGKLFVLAIMGMALSLTAFSASLTAFIPKTVSQLVALMAGIGSSIINGLSGVAGSTGLSAESIGRAMIDGMVRGLKEGSYKVTAAANKVAGDALKAAKTTLGVASPSKEFYKVGAWSAEGMADGLNQNGSEVTDAASQMGYSAISAIKKSISGIATAMDTNLDLNPTITPVLDLTQFKKDATSVSGMLAPRVLNVDSSYSKASTIAVATRTQTEQTEIDAAVEGKSNDKSSVVFIQNNNSPKSLSQAEIYRQTKNQLSVAKGELDK